MTSRKKLNVILYILTISLFTHLFSVTIDRNVYAKESTNSAGTQITNQDQTNTPPIIDKIDNLEKQIEKNRDENILLLLNRSEAAILHADRVIELTLGISTFFGVLITIISVVIGGSFKNLLGQLRKHVTFAKNQSEIVENISKEAQKQAQDLKVTINELMKAKDATTKTHAEIADKDKAIENLITKANDSLTQIELLKDTAKFITGTTTYPAELVGTTSQIGLAGTGSFPLNVNTCERCGKPLTFQDTFTQLKNSAIGAVTLPEQDICSECLNKTSKVK